MKRWQSCHRIQGSLEKKKKRKKLTRFSSKEWIMGNAELIRIECMIISCHWVLSLMEVDDE